MLKTTPTAEATAVAVVTVGSIVEADDAGENKVTEGLAPFRILLEFRP